LDLRPQRQQVAKTLRIQLGVDIEAERRLDQKLIGALGRARAST
jgi:hypothetical protein